MPSEKEDLGAFIFGSPEKKPDYVDPAGTEYDFDQIFAPTGEQVDYVQTKQNIKGGFDLEKYKRELERMRRVGEGAQMDDAPRPLQAPLMELPTGEVQRYDKGNYIDIQRQFPDDKINLLTTVADLKEDGKFKSNVLQQMDEIVNVDLPEGGSFKRYGAILAGNPEMQAEILEGMYEGTPVTVEKDPDGFIFVQTPDKDYIFDRPGWSDTQWHEVLANISTSLGTGWILTQVKNMSKGLTWGKRLLATTGAAAGLGAVDRSIADYAGELSGAETKSSGMDYLFSSALGIAGDKLADGIGYLGKKIGYPLLNKISQKIDDRVADLDTSVEMEFISNYFKNTDELLSMKSQLDQINKDLFDGEEVITMAQYNPHLRKFLGKGSEIETTSMKAYDNFHNYLKKRDPALARSLGKFMGGVELDKSIAKIAEKAPDRAKNVLKSMNYLDGEILKNTLKRHRGEFDLSKGSDLINNFINIQVPKESPEINNALKKAVNLIREGETKKIKVSFPRRSQPWPAKKIQVDTVERPFIFSNATKLNNVKKALDDIVTVIQNEYPLEGKSPNHVKAIVAALRPVNKMVREKLNVVPMHDDLMKKMAKRSSYIKQIRDGKVGTLADIAEKQTKESNDARALADKVFSGLLNNNEIRYLGQVLGGDVFNSLKKVRMNTIFNESMDLTDDTAVSISKALTDPSLYKSLQPGQKANIKAFDQMFKMSQIMPKEVQLIQQGPSSMAGNLKRQVFSWLSDMIAMRGGLRFFGPTVGQAVAEGTKPNPITAGRLFNLLIDPKLTPKLIEFRRYLDSKKNLEGTKRGIIELFNDMATKESVENF